MGRQAANSRAAGHSMKQMRVKALMRFIVVIALCLVPIRMIWSLFQPSPVDEMLHAARQDRVMPDDFRLDDYFVRATWVKSTTSFKGGYWEMHCEHKKTGERRCFQYVEQLLMGGFFEIQCSPSSASHPVR
jgi:hypothetical protein